MKFIHKKTYACIITLLLASCTDNNQPTSDINNVLTKQNAQNNTSQTFIDNELLTTQLKKQWLAGDHHIHGKYSAKWDLSTTPPTPILRGDAQYTTAVYAKMAKLYGLSWIVTTDHGGPNHSELNITSAYNELLASREATPDVLQFYGMEFDVPSGRHASLIIPYSTTESNQLYAIEKNYSRREIEPDKTTRDTNEFMLNALNAINAQVPKPLIIVNHPARLSKDLGQYNKVSPEKIRSWHNAAPELITGMEGAPGHQANALNPDGSTRHTGKRGGYNNYPTMGGFDQMTAKLGGFWDSMLGEGRHWWITATSDSHMHYTEGRTDFWPGEYSKTYVHAEKTYSDVLSNIRHGNMFVTTGDLITELYINIDTINKKSVNKPAVLGQTINLKKGDSISISIKFLDPETLNGGYQNPKVKRVDLIAGALFKTPINPNKSNNDSTQVIKRFTSPHWQKEGKYTVINYTLNSINHSSYIRLRGTNTNELEPEIDPAGENPWSDLWFYSNPIFIKVK